MPAPRWWRTDTYDDVSPRSPRRPCHHTVGRHLGSRSQFVRGRTERHGPEAGACGARITGGETTGFMWKYETRAFRTAPIVQGFSQWVRPRTSRS